MNVALSEKDRKFREFALEGSMWKVIWKVCYPLAIYQSLNQLFKILDTMMAAHISANAVSTVAYLSQINMAISALGGGLAVGASIKISEAYGEGNFELVKRRVSTLFALCGLLGMAILAILIPVAPHFLRLANTPEEFIEEGTVYFILELVSLVIIFFNNVYIAIERARGNSKRILNLNMMVIGIKLSLTAFFVYVLKGGINYISIATIVSQLALLGVAVFYMNAKENVFGFSWKAISFRKLVVAPMIKLSVPVISIYEKLQELGLGNRIMEEQNIFLPCPEREKRELLKQIRSFLTAEPKILSSANCCGLGGCAALKEPELAGQMAKSAGSIQNTSVYCASCAGNLTRAGGKNIKHLLVQILGREEVPDVRHSLWNRVRAGR